MEFAAGRRDYDIRLRRLEDLVQALDKIVAVTDVRVQGLMQTLESRFKAFDHGQSLILSKLNETSPVTVTTSLAHRIENLEELRSQAQGAIWLARIIGATWIVGAAVWIYKMLHG
jgi:hypothetical protein